MYIYTYVCVCLVLHAQNDEGTYVGFFLNFFYHYFFLRNTSQI